MWFIKEFFIGRFKENLLMQGQMTQKTDPPVPCSCLTDLMNLLRFPGWTSEELHARDIQWIKAGSPIKFKNHGIGTKLTSVWSSGTQHGKAKEMFNVNFPVTRAKMMCLPINSEPEKEKSMNNHNYTNTRRSSRRNGIVAYFLGALKLASWFNIELHANPIIVGFLIINSPSWILLPAIQVKKNHEILK